MEDLAATYQRLTELYPGPSVLVDDHLELLHVGEGVGEYLGHRGGVPSQQLMQLIHPALRLPLRSALVGARLGRDRTGIETGRLDATRVVGVHAIAVDLGFLIVFEKSAELAERQDLMRVVEALEDDLVRTRAELRLANEQHQAAVEALRAANQDLQALNEELTSTANELESREHELTVANEELLVLNRELERTAQSIGRAHADLENLVRSSQLATVFLDLELCLVKFTPDCVDVFPLIETDIGRPLRELQSRLAGITTEDLLAHVTRVLAKLEASELEATTTNGHSFLVRILPYRNHDERVEGVVLTFIDISDARAARTAAAASEERLRIAVRSAPLVMISLAGQRVEWGYAYGEPLAPPATAFALFTRASYDRLIALGEQVARTGSGARVELELVIAGQARTHDFRIEPSALGVIAVGFDITPRKLAEASLIEIDRRKDEFLATLSHELRNPLTPLTVALDIAKLAPHDPAIQAEAREIMEHQVRQLSRLVDELLDLSRITRGKIEIRRERVDVVHAAQLAIEATRPLVVQHNHTLDVEVSATAPCVVGDEARLVQIVTNLLTNAAKYTPDGGRLELAITIDRDGGRVAIRVRDNGIGIAADKLGEIFDMFFQSRDARGRSQGGLGIGLNLVHRLVALHGGSVRATSDGPGRGSEFVVELPLAA